MYIPLQFEDLNKSLNIVNKKAAKLRFLNYNIINDQNDVFIDYTLNNQFIKVQNIYKIFFQKYYDFNVLFFAKTQFYKNKFIFINSNFFKINYNPTDMALNLNTTKLLNFFIRKNKIFNKGRYSRNR